MSGLEEEMRHSYEHHLSHAQDEIDALQARLDVAEARLVRTVETLRDAQANASIDLDQAGYDRSRHAWNCECAQCRGQDDRAQARLDAAEPLIGVAREVVAEAETRCRFVDERDLPEEIKRLRNLLAAYDELARSGDA